MKKILIYLVINVICITKSNAQLTMIWKNDSVFKSPECVVYDKDNECLYVSNYNKSPKEGSLYNEDYISKVNLNGKVIDEKYVCNLTAPTGLCIFNKKLFIVERTGVVKFDIKSSTVETRYWISDTEFLNDVAVDSLGSVYVSDSERDIIYRITEDTIEKWIESPEISKTNGIIVDGNKLIVGVNSDRCLKSILINDKTIKKIASFPPGIIDGIKKYKNGYFVSHYEGNLYFVNKDGELNELLSTRANRINCADFEYIDGLELFVIPALEKSILFGYRYHKNIKD